MMQDKATIGCTTVKGKIHENYKQSNIVLKTVSIGTQLMVNQLLEVI